MRIYSCQGVVDGKISEMFFVAFSREWANAIHEAFFRETHGLPQRRTIDDLQAAMEDGGLVAFDTQRGVGFVHPKTASKPVVLQA